MFNVTASATWYTENISALSYTLTVSVYFSRTFSWCPALSGTRGIQVSVAGRLIGRTSIYLEPRDWRADHVWRFRSVRPLNVAPDPALPSITYSRVSGLSGLAIRSFTPFALVSPILWGISSILRPYFSS